MLSGAHGNLLDVGGADKLNEDIAKLKWQRSRQGATEVAMVKTSRAEPLGRSSCRQKMK